MMKDTLRLMLVEFFIILSGTTICAAFFCTVFYSEGELGVDFLWEMIVLSFLTALPQLLFYSKKEFTKRQMTIRQTVHLILVVGLLIFLAYTWEWVEFTSIVEPLAFVVLVLIAYASISWYMYQQEKKLANRLNEKLKKFKDSKGD